MEFSLPIIDWTSVGSLVLVAGTGLAALILSLFTKSLRFVTGVTFAGIVVTGAYSVSLWGIDTTGFGGMLILDNLTLALYIIILSGTILTLFLSREFLKSCRPVKGEYLALLCFSTFGMMVMAAAGDLIMIFLGLETLSISLYILSGFRRTDEFCLEAALKYFLLGAFASGFLLYGMPAARAS